METVSVIINFILSGGIIALLTLRSTRKKAAEEAEASEISNAESLLSLQAGYIVEPLKKEINALRKEVRRLHRAVEAIRDCPHSVDCPVRQRMQADDADQ